MGIARFEPVEIENVVTVTSAYGEQSSSTVLWYKTRAVISSVANSLLISERYRIYSDLVFMTFNYNSNTKKICDDQNLYAIKYRGKDWRIVEVRETNDRMKVTLLCYRNDPSTTV